MSDIGIKILVLDDEESIRRMISEHLEDFDIYSVQTAADTEEALELLQAAGVDLAIVDLRLPGVSGMDFIRQASITGRCRHFLIHTGSNDVHLSSEMMKLGLSDADIFFKPADLDHIMMRITELLNPEDK